MSGGLRLAVGLLALVAMSVTADPGRVAAALPVGPERQSPDGQPSNGADELVPEPGAGLTPEVAAVPASSPVLDAVTEELEALVLRRNTDLTLLVTAGTDREATSAELAAVRSLAERRTAQVAKATAAVDRVRVAVRALGVERFVTGDDALEGLDPALTARRRAELANQRVLTEVGSEQLLADLAHTEARRASLEEERAGLVRQRDLLTRQRDDLDARVADLTASLEGLGPRIVDAEERLGIARMSATIDGTDLSATSLDAYWRAIRYVSVLDPDCGLTWDSLAGIGRTESRHGTYRGAVLGTDGGVAPPIFGPDLDGSNEFAVIADSDGGALDGTARTDRAVGPMQFLPSTWAVVGTDLDGDGSPDPQNLFDAAASAAVYLCRSGPDLGQPERLRRAYLSYNRSQEYADIVTERAGEYRSAVALG